LVAVGLDEADAVARVGLPRRPGVVVVGFDGDDEAAAWRYGVAVGAETVLFLPQHAEALVERLGDAADGQNRAVTVGVTGARGGAGASTLAAALALSAGARALRTVLVDTDP